MHLKEAIMIANSMGKSLRSSVRMFLQCHQATILTGKLTQKSSLAIMEDACSDFLTRNFIFRNTLIRGGSTRELKSTPISTTDDE